jgi:hypothetical protein
MPGVPTERTLTITSTEGNSDITMVELHHQGIDLAVSHTVYPPLVDTTTTTARAAVLTSARDGLVQHVGGKLLEDKAVPWQDHPGRQLVIRAGDGRSTVHARMVLVRNVLYQLMVTAPTPQLPALGARFLSSFRLIR